MRRLVLAAALVPLLALPALAEGLTVTGSNGGTIKASRECTRGGGQAQCASASQVTGPEGRTASRTRVRTSGQGFSTADVAITGANGETRTRKRTATWGN